MLTYTRYEGCGTCSRRWTSNGVLSTVSSCILLLFLCYCRGSFIFFFFSIFPPVVISTTPFFSPTSEHTVHRLQFDSSKESFAVSNILRDFNLCSCSLRALHVIVFIFTYFWPHSFTSHFKTKTIRGFYISFSLSLFLSLCTLLFPWSSEIIQFFPCFMDAKVFVLCLNCLWVCVFTVSVTFPLIFSSLGFW